RLLLPEDARAVQRRAQGLLYPGALLLVCVVFVDQTGEEFPGGSATCRAIALEDLDRLCVDGRINDHGINPSGGIGGVGHCCYRHRLCLALRKKKRHPERRTGTHEWHITRWARSYSGPRAPPSYGFSPRPGDEAKPKGKSEPPGV